MVKQVYDRLRESIIQLKIKPGEKINIKQLSAELKVSATPIREALQKLTEQGFVSSEPYVGYVVIQLPPKDVQEIFEIRKMLELYALRHGFGNLREVEVRGYLERLQQMEGYLSKTGSKILLEETTHFDKDLHGGLIMRSTGNQWFIRYADGILDLIVLSTRLSMNPEAAYVEHREILEAIMQYDLSRAARALEDHIERSKRDAISAVMKKYSTNYPPQADGVSEALQTERLKGRGIQPGEIEKLFYEEG